MMRPGPGGSGSTRKGTPRDMPSLLARYVRYAALIEFQEEALEEEDLERFHELAREREELQKELDEAPGSGIEPASPDPGHREHLDRLYAALKEAVSADARLRARLQEMKRGTSKEVGAAQGRARELRGYLERDEVGSGSRSKRLNVRL